MRILSASFTQYGPVLLALLVVSQSSLWDGAASGRPSFLRKQFGFGEITLTNLDEFQRTVEHEFIIMANISDEFDNERNPSSRSSSAAP